MQVFFQMINLSKQILKAGEKVEEKLWRMPLRKIIKTYEF